ncbi:MAG: dTMP kinase [Chloroflexota bacterium]
MTPRGRFIVFEGPEGAGKSTQQRLLASSLEARGVSVISTREPGGTPIGEQVREILLHVNNTAMAARTEALLYAASRAQHVAELIEPTLSAGGWVLCDRFLDSSLAYQSGGRELPLAEVQALQQFAVGSCLPDLRILLDLPVAVGLGRRFGDAEQVNRLDLADLAFHERVRTAYHVLVQQDPASWIVIDAERPPDEVAAAVLNAVAPMIPASATGVQ